MARTKASARADAQQRRARELELYEDSDEEERPTQRQRVTPPADVSTVSVAKPLAPDGSTWDIEGNWVITTNNNNYRGPYNWSVFDAGAAVFANFKLGPVYGILKLDKTIAQLGPPRRNKSKFTWRGRETGEGQMCTDWHSQNGELVFKHIEGGFMLLEGSINGAYGSFKFVGQRVGDQPSNTANQWEFFSDERYEQERVARWR